MALTMPFGDEDEGFITCALITPPSTTPVFQSALPNGQTVGSVVSADPATVTIALDSPAVANPAQPTVASFTVKSAATPAAPNTPITITLTILNSDGSTYQAFTDTVTVSETATEVIGDLFGTPIAQTA